MLANWATLQRALDAKAGSATELHKCRVRHLLLTADDAEQIVAMAADSNGGSPRGVLPQHLHQACREVVGAAQPPPKRNFLDGTAGESAIPGTDAADAASTVTESTAVSPVSSAPGGDWLAGKTWSIPAAMVREIARAYEGATSEGLTAEALLAKEYKTATDKLKLRALSANFQRFSIPMDVTHLSFAEAVNLFDERYAEIRVEVSLTNEECVSLANKAAAAA